MNKKKTITGKSLKEEFRLIFFLSTGVFLFILFFQPFPLDSLEYNDRLIYVTGFALISFLSASISLVIIPFIFPRLFPTAVFDKKPATYQYVLLIASSGTAYSFYIRYVGNDFLNLYLLFKIFLVCLIPVIFLIILYKNKSLENLIISLRKQNKVMAQQILEISQTDIEEEFDLVSSNNADRVRLSPKDILMVKSADNYIEIYFLENNVVEKKLIRNTLKNIEILLLEKGKFSRCHRTCIVNLSYVEKIVRNYNGNFLVLSYMDEKIPVSRQYLSIIRENLS